MNCRRKWFHTKGLEEKACGVARQPVPGTLEVTGYLSIESGLERTDSSDC